MTGKASTNPAAGARDYMFPQQPAFDAGSSLRL